MFGSYPIRKEDGIREEADVQYVIKGMVLHALLYFSELVTTTLHADETHFNSYVGFNREVYRSFVCTGLRQSRSYSVVHQVPRRVYRDVTIFPLRIC